MGELCGGECSLPPLDKEKERAMINVGVPVARFVCQKTGSELGYMYQYAVTGDVVSVWYTVTGKPEVPVHVESLSLLRC